MRGDVPPRVYNVDATLGFVSMKFCPNCRALLVVARVNGRVLLRCSKCGYEEDAGSVRLVDKTVSRKNNSPILVKETKEGLPRIRARCSRCGNEEAYFWTQQTRAADEPPTRFYRCTNCGYTWREYE